MCTFAVGDPLSVLHFAVSPCKPRPNLGLPSRAIFEWVRTKIFRPVNVRNVCDLRQWLRQVLRVQAACMLCARAITEHAVLGRANNFGQLGYEDTEHRGDEPNEMGDNLPIVNLGAGRRAYSVVGSAGSHCALLDGGEIKCWGLNSDGELGLGDMTNRGDKAGQMGDNLPAVKLGTGRTAVQLVCGDHHSCVLLDNGDVKCWGQNTRGQLGLGDVASRGVSPNQMGDNLPRVELGTGRRALWVAAGIEHSCAVLDNGDLKCWGYNAALGLGDQVDRGVIANQMGDMLPAVNLGTGLKAISVAGGRGHTCAVLNNHMLKCWGWNRNGVLGYGDLVDRGSRLEDMGDNLPEVALGTGPGQKVVLVSCSKDDVCALLNDTGVKCWGSNSYGQLGLENSLTYGDVPEEMGDGLQEIDFGSYDAHVARLTVGYDHNCVELKNQSVKCWGRNQRGQLGYGDRLERGSRENTLGDLLPRIQLAGPSDVQGCYPCGEHATSPPNSVSYAECICDVGYTGENGGLCTACIPGWYKPESGSMPCSICPAGTWQNMSASSACEQCPANTGSLSSTDSIADCYCNAGYTGPGAYACSACGGGTYKAVNGSSSCELCPDGTYSRAVAATQCDLCPPFTTSPEGSFGVDACLCALGYTGPSTNCTPCNAGEFKSVNGSGACSLCPRGTYQNATGQTLCIGCPADSFSNRGSTSIQGCICDAGYAGRSGACSPCLGGTYKASNGSGACVLCPQNTWSNLTAVTECLACPPQSVSLRGAEDIHRCVCDRGYSGPDGGPCKACDLGKYKAENGSVPCLDCAEGFFSNATGSSTCLPCPANSDSEPGTPTCRCMSGYTGPDGAACTACGIGEYKQELGSASCSDCRPGTFQDALGSKECRSCSANSSSTAGSSICVCNVGFSGPDGGNCSSCLPGKYKSLNGSSVCIDCARGTFSSQQGQSQCDACPADSNSQAGRAACVCDAGFSGSFESCVACGLGTYKAINGSSDCVECARGTYLDQEAGTTCASCPSNSTALVGSPAVQSCICTPGFTGPDGGPCTACNLGTYKADNGSLSCVDCARGTYLDSTGATVCRSCPSDSYSDLATTSIDGCTCNAGYSGQDGGPCVACSPGTFKASPGSEACSPCEAGTFMNASGATECSQCPANTFSKTGRKQVQDCVCNMGYTGPDGGSCLACALGKFKTINGSATCTLCPGGTYLNLTGGTSCRTCPPDSSSIPGRAAIEECSCNPGFTNGDSFCRACQPGTFKPTNGSALCSQCAVGTFQNSSGATYCSTCPLRSTAPRGSPDIGDCICDPGSTGIAGGPCEQCSIGTYKALNGSASCVHCPADTYMAELGASRCLACPANSISNLGSDDIARCVCHAGYTGPNGGPCDPCGLGQYKSVNGSGGCMLCGVATYQNATGSSTCRSCTPFSSSLTGQQSPTGCLCIAGHTGSDGGPCSACAAGEYKAQNGSDSCLLCRGGTYSNESAASTCTSCTAQSFSAVGSDTIEACRCDVGYEGRDGGPCSACLLGRYKPTNGSDACQRCPSATYQPGRAGTVCASCPPLTDSQLGARRLMDCLCIPGHSGPDGGNCTACGVGTYKPGNGSVACTQCEAGKFQNMTGQTSCISCSRDSDSLPGMSFCLCNAGFTGDASPVCDACEKGAYKAVNGTSACIACSRGTFSDFIAASACVTCPSHTSSQPGSDMLQDCICVPGFSGPDGGTCSGCPRGQYKAINGSEACVNCNVGTYQNLTNATSCTQCPSLKTSGSGSAAFNDCLCIEGYTGPPGAPCQACALGKFKPASGPESCSSCDAGTYLNISAGTSCKTCPAYTFSAPESPSKQSCVCDAGYSGPDGGTCSPCSPGLFKAENGSSACTSCRAGLFANMSAGTMCFSCPSNSHSLPGSDARTACVCNAGYTGPDGGPCSACLVGEFKAENGSALCQSCAAGQYGNLTAATACTLCPVNSGSDPGSTDIAYCTCDPAFSGPDGGPCSACAPGTFKVVQGSEACLPCAAGTYNNASAMTACATCPSSSDSAAASVAIQGCICNIGYTGNDGGPCSACLAGSFKDRNGSAACSLCQPGFYLDAQGQSVCLQCPEHTLSLPGTPSIQGCVCREGYEGPDGGQCSGCATGRYKDVNGSAACGLCRAGTFANETHSTVCRQCPSNTDATPGASICICNPGHTGPGGGTCQACDPGSYKMVNGTSSCKLCASGTFMNSTGATACLACPARSDSSVGSPSRTGCICDPGYSGPDGGPCVACPLGKYKPTDGSNPCLDCAAGTYQNNTAMTACSQCKANTNSRSGSMAETFCTCNAGYSGPNAGHCTACQVISSFLSRLTFSSFRF